MPSIYAYFDFRDFLKDDFIRKRAKNPKYSYRAVARKIGINSGTITRILNGKRNLSGKLLPEFIKYLKLKTKEAEYFKLLVVFNQTKDREEKRMCYKDIVRLRNERKKNIEPNQYEFYHEWYYCAVRELLRFYPFRGDFEDLSKMINPPIMPNQLRRAINLLERLGFVEKKHDGSFKVTDTVITTGEKWQGTAIHQFQIDMIKKALYAIDYFPKDERDISTLTVGLSESSFYRVRDVLKHTRDEILAIEESDSSQERVYQINFQLFPLSNRNKGN